MAEPAGVVDQQVEATASAREFIGDGGDLPGLGGVGAPKAGGAAAAEPVQAVDVGGRAGDAGDVLAGGGEALDDGAADPLAGAGDEDRRHGPPFCPLFRRDS